VPDRTKLPPRIINSWAAANTFYGKNAMNQSDELWRLYFAEVLKHATGGVFDPNAFKFSPASIINSISLGDFEPNIVNWTSYILGDTIPSTTGSYAPASGLFINYWLFLSYVIPESDSIRNKDIIENYRQKICQCAIESIQQRPNLLHEGTMKPFSAKEAIDPDSMMRLLLAQDIALQNAHQSIVEALKRPNDKASSLNDALNRCSRASSQTSNSCNMPVSANTGNINAYCPLYLLRNFDEAFAKWKENSADSGLRIEITPSTSASDKASQQHEIVANLPATRMPIQFLNFAVSDNIRSHNGNFGRLIVEFAGFGTFNLDQGIWFDNSLIEQYKPKLPSGCPQFFKEEGSMNLLPQKVVIGFRPRISLSIPDKDSTQRMATTFNSIGPFSISSSPSEGILQPGRRMSDGENIVFDSHKTSVPVLLGVISKWL
jgi:hypothetical protein